MIVEIYHSPYHLTPKNTLNSKVTTAPRNGALLRFHFADGAVGYADCHPWAELGDEPLDQQLKLLSQGQFTPLTHKCVQFAKENTIFQKYSKIFSIKTRPLLNHFIVPYEILTKEDIPALKRKGFQFIKLKFGINIEKEIQFVHDFYSLLDEHKIKLRLDFNSSLSSDKADDFFSVLKGQLNIFDFVEDPCPFHSQAWLYLQAKHGVSLALDRKNEEIYLALQDLNHEIHQCFKVLIVKPALEDLNFLFTTDTTQRVVFTSYMDHPLGQLSALSEAQRYYEQFPQKQEHCGFLTHSLYAENKYSRLLKIEKASLSYAEEAFKSLLEMEEWVKL